MGRLENRQHSTLLPLACIRFLPHAYLKAGCLFNDGVMLSVMLTPAPS